MFARAALVAAEVYASRVPHREAVRAGEARDLPPVGAFGMPDPDVGRGAAPVALPGGVLGVRAPGEGPLPARRVDVDQRGVTEGQLLRIAAGRGDRVELPVAVWLLAARAEEDARAVRGPAHHVVRVGMPGQAPRLAAGDRDQVHVAVPVVLAGERDRPPVRREARVVLVAVMRREPPAAPTLVGRHPEIRLGDEDDHRAVDVGMAEVAGGGGGRGGGGGHDGDRE